MKPVPTLPTRRLIVGGGLTALAACVAAPPRSADTQAWTLGFHDAPAAGLGPSRLTLVAGKPPSDLKGTLYRNGPAQLHYGAEGVRHWFDGDGMVHRLRIEGAEATHTARFVDTPSRRAEQAAGRFLSPGFGTTGDPTFPVTSADDVNRANTSVLFSDGELLALWEAGSAYRLDPVTLETRGKKSWRQDLKAMPFLAHPKREPDGRVWNFAVNDTRIGVYRIGADGALEDFGLIDMGVSAYLHDWAMSERSLILLVQPWIRTRSSASLIDDYDWRPQDGLKILVVDKSDFSRRRWAQAPARAFYHTGGAWEEADGTLRVDVAFYRKPALGPGGGADLIRGTFSAESLPAAALEQVVIPPSGDARIEAAGVTGEFPQVDPRRQGHRRRWTLLASGGAGNAHPGPTGLALHDWESGRTTTFDFGPNCWIEEHLFVPKPGGQGETDAWLVGTSINLAEGREELNVFDAAHLANGPIARWRADYAWPLGFHGTWSA